MTGPGHVGEGRATDPAVQPPCARSRHHMGTSVRPREPERCPEEGPCAGGAQGSPQGEAALLGPTGLWGPAPPSRLQPAAGTPGTPRRAGCTPGPRSPWGRETRLPGRGASSAPGALLCAPGSPRLSGRLPGGLRKEGRGPPRAGPPNMGLCSGPASEPLELRSEQWPVVDPEHHQGRDPECGVTGSGKGPDWQRRGDPPTQEGRGGVRVGGEQLTSYFCCLNFSCRSNFSASRL